MIDFRIILESIRQKDEQAFTEFYDAFRPKSVKKGEYLIQIGDIAKYTYFIVSGSTKHYRYKTDGVEHIIWFNFAGELTLAHKSFITQTPSTDGIVALEDCEFQVISRQSTYALAAKFHAVETFYRECYELEVMAMNERQFLLQSSTAKEKYDYILEHFPHFIKRLSQKDISSFLGISRETLSRIRKP